MVEVVGSIHYEARVAGYRTDCNNRGGTYRHVSEDSSSDLVGSGSQSEKE